MSLTGEPSRRWNALFQKQWQRRQSHNNHQQYNHKDDSGWMTEVDCPANAEAFLDEDRGIIAVKVERAAFPIAVVIAW